MFYIDSVAAVCAHTEVSAQLRDDADMVSCGAGMGEGEVQGQERGGRQPGCHQLSNNYCVVLSVVTVGL